MKKKILLALVIIILSTSQSNADDLKTLRLKTDFNIWNLNLEKNNIVNEYQKQYWNNMEVLLPKYLNEDIKKKVENSLEKKSVKGVDYVALKKYLDKWVSKDVNRERQDVKIYTDENSNIKFEGFAFDGQSIDTEDAFELIKYALKKNISDIRLPIKIDKAKVDVESDILKEKGIKELIANGETNYVGSPYNRVHNIKTGLNKFNAWLIEKNSTSSITGKLGPVNASTGYLPELVIKGSQTIPEYGGGLCQVSTTIYRSLLFAGLPIKERKNHSYAVSYYDPQGLDATIYIPNPDLKFVNDTENSILIQTTTIGTKAYSNIYGTKPERDVSLLGPWYYNHKAAPAKVIEYVDSLPAGKKQVVSGHHPGFDASWYRVISYNNSTKKDVLEHIFSRYEARGLHILIGKSKTKTEVEEKIASENGT